MLKKGKWLRKWRRLMVESGFFEPWMIEVMQNDAVMDWKQELSPSESVESNIDDQIVLNGVFGEGVIC